MLAITEKILVHQIKNGDEQAFALFYNKYQQKIYRFICFRVSDQEKAQDLVSDTFIRVFDYLRDGREIKNFQAFLYKTARNLVIDFYRSRRDEVSLEDAPEVISEEDMREQADEKLVIENIRKHLSEIEPIYQDPVLLHFFDGLSFKQVAEVLDITQTNARQRAHRGFKKLKSVVKFSF